MSVFFMTVEFIIQFCLTNLYYYNDSIIKVMCKKAYGATEMSRTALNAICMEPMPANWHPLVQVF